MTEQEWKRVLPLLENVKPERQQAAYNRLVKGVTLAKAGEPYGYSRQDVNALCNAVLRKHAKLLDEPEKYSIPAGWTRATFVVPRRKLADLRRVVEALYPQTGAQPDPGATKDRHEQTGPIGPRRRRSK